MTNRYIDEANTDYEGKAVAITETYDRYGETHIIVEMKCDDHTYYLDWIGGEYADEPDEFETLPFKNLNWRKVK